MRRSTWLGWVGGTAVGVLIGGGSALLFSMPSSHVGALPALPSPTETTGKQDAKATQLAGRARAVIHDFSIEDLDGHKVVSAKEIVGVLDLVALGAHTVHMPSGHARSIALLLRRGKSGRVSLAEALGKREGGGDKGNNVLAIGPMQIVDTRMTVAVGERPVVFQIDRAVVRVEKKLGESAPKLFLSGIHGYMADPDPLPQPVRIHGGQGVIDLAGHPLVDLRARVCIGGDEMRVQIEIPERQGPVHLRVDADGFSARVARMTLNMVAKSKERLDVAKGPVAVPEAYDCTREEGKESRDQVKEDVEQSRDSVKKDVQARDSDEPPVEAPSNMRERRQERQERRRERREDSP
jgi:hypothetical protein